MKKRVLIAGLYHETHTFLEEPTPPEDFAVLRGSELFKAAGDANPLGGALEVAVERGWELVPAIDLRASPSGTVDERVVETFWTALRDAARGELHGIYLVLHGAMVSERHADVEGELLTRIRATRGLERLPIAGVLDLHANVSDRMTATTQGLIAYRENPHTDARQAAVDAARLLDRLLETGKQPVTVREAPPIVWTPGGTATAAEPMKTLEAMAREIERSRPEILAVNVLGGFAFADTPDTGVSFTAVTLGDPERARAELRRLSRAAFELRDEGNVRPPALEDVLPKLGGPGPVVVTEPSDNVGGGAPGDGTAVLRALLERRVPGVAAVLADGDAVREAWERKPGERFRTRVGGKKSRLGAGPLDLEVELVSKSDGRFELEDPQSHQASMAGRRIDMGPCVVLRHAGARILVTTRKTPPFDLGQLRSQGIEPRDCSVIVVKAAVAHRRAYDPIARASYAVETPGPCSSDLAALPYKRIRRPIFPLDRVETLP